MEKSRFKAHPWHGISPGEQAPETVNAFIEIVPEDTVKYEIDKQSGYLRIDRPQKFSNTVPALYGFVPQTYCGEQVARSASGLSGRVITAGDGDPLDICVLCEKNISHGNILLEAIPIGGFCLLDKGEADDKIIAVMRGDEVYQWKDLSECPPALIDRLKHYFLTYKNLPGESTTCEIISIYGREQAQQVIGLSISDYKKTFGGED